MESFDTAVGLLAATETVAQLAERALSGTDSPVLAIAIRLWWLALGGCVGSFLNVVVYRLPRGMSLSRPGSHCPKCGHAIRWHDNVPVLGWLWLGGRCRDCRTPIAARYPLVEALCAVLFFVIGEVECLGLGRNLPYSPVIAENGLPTGPLTTFQAFGVALYHLVLLATLVPAAFTAHDRQPLRPRLFLAALIVGLVAPLVWPTVQPQLFTHGAWQPAQAWLSTSVGLLVGALVGAATAPNRREGAWTTALVGLFLGWKAAIVAAAFATLANLLATRGFRLGERRHWFAWLAVATLAWILAWNWVATIGPLR